MKRACSRVIQTFLHEECSCLSLPDSAPSKHRRKIRGRRKQGSEACGGWVSMALLQEIPAARKSQRHFAGTLWIPEPHRTVRALNGKRKANEP